MAHAADADTRPLLTPEGVVLRLAVPNAGDRIGAFVLDLVLQGLAMAGFALLLFAAGLAGRGTGGDWLVTAWLLGSFVLRMFWFVAFEGGRRAATPGKRRFGLRVASRDGGPLTPGAVLARNLTRELEVFLPLGAASLPGAAENGTTYLAALLWTGLFLVFPLLNRDRLRVGDLIAGTWVVRVPKPVLAPDLAASAPRAVYQFSDAQLDAYGIYELQRLEDVLRRSGPAMRRPADDPVTVVAAAVRRKIGWPAGGDDHELLSAYYAALKDRLERGLVFGRRKADKHDRS